MEGGRRQCNRPLEVLPLAVHAPTHPAPSAYTYNTLVMFNARRGHPCTYRVGSAVLLSAWLVLLSAAAPARAQSASPNLLKNPGFDWPAQTNGDVCAPGWQKDNAITPHEWTAYWTCKSGEEVFQDQINRPPEFRVITVDIAPDRVRSYPTSASFFNYHSLNRSVGLYQIVRDVTPGTRLRFSVWVNLLTTNSSILPLSSAREPGGLRARACIHTTGNVFLTPNLNDPAVVCSDWIRPYDTWGEAVVEATAAMNIIAVIVDATADYPVIHNDVHVDDASLVVVGGAPTNAQPTPSPSQPPTATIAESTPAVIVKTPTANIRAAPSFDGAIITQVGLSTRLPVRAYTADFAWWQVEFSGAPGGVAYIHSSVVTPNPVLQALIGTGAPASQPATPAQPTPTPQASRSEPPVVTANTGGSRLNVRAVPSPSGRILGRVPNGTRLSVLSVSADGQWWQVSYANGTAWVMARYVIPNAAARQLAGR